MPDVLQPLAHGLVQGASSELQGGDFQSGFIGGAVGSLAGPLVSRIGGDGPTGVLLRTATAGVIGGTASKLGGGSFINGAVTAAFVHAFNYELHNWQARSWMERATAELGVSEVTGAGSNSRIIEYHSTTSLAARSDSVPWCSSFVNWVLNSAGIPGTQSATALSWRNWGVSSRGPTYGAVAVIDYGGGKGHVGLVAGVSATGGVVLLGGNQSDTVKYSTFTASKIVTYRMPASEQSWNGRPVYPAWLAAPMLRGNFSSGGGYGATR